MSRFSSRKPARPTYICEECNRRIEKWNAVCPRCGAAGSVREATPASAERRQAKLAKEEQRQAVGATPLAKMIAEKLAISDTRAMNVAGELLGARPKGCGLSEDEAVQLLDEVTERMKKEPKDNPPGYLLVMGRHWYQDQRKKRVLPPPGELEKKWVKLEYKGRGGPAMQSIADVIKEIGAPVPSGGPGEEDIGEDGCKQCGGAGWQKVGWEKLGSQYRTRIEPCGCSSEAPEERSARLLERSGLAGNMLGMTLEGLERLPGLEEATEAAQRFLAGEVSQLVLIGRPGAGKTHIAVSCLRACIEQGMAGFYLNVSRYLDVLRTSYEKTSQQTFGEIFQPALSWPVLVIDDLGAERQTEWAREKVYEIVDARYSVGARTIACSNFAPETWDERVLSRLCDRARSAVVLLRTTDYRLRAEPARV